MVASSLISPSAWACCGLDANDGKLTSNGMNRISETARAPCVCPWSISFPLIEAVQDAVKL